MLGRLAGEGGLVMAWALAFLLIASAAWALAAALLPRRNGTRHGDLFCAYCGWGLSRVGGYDTYRWGGGIFCSLACLRLEGALRERESGLPR